MLGLNSMVQRDPDIIAAEAGKDIVMVSVANGFYYGVSEVAREIWRIVEHPRKVSDVVDDLVQVYEVDRRACEKQVLLFLEDLLAEHLVQVKDGASNCPPSADN
jgi:hypothetical protein